MTAWVWRATGTGANDVPLQTRKPEAGETRRPGRTRRRIGMFGAADETPSKEGVACSQRNANKVEETPGKAQAILHSRTAVRWKLPPAPLRPIRKFWVDARGEPRREARAGTTKPSAKARQS